jgi:hypothetical protein
MRIKNKEIQKRRHRKEQTIKAANRELRKLYGDKPKPAAVAAAPEKAKAKKPAAEKAAEPKKAPVKKAAPKAEGVEEAPKPKAKRAPKKAEDAPAE